MLDCYRCGGKDCMEEDDRGILFCLHCGHTLYPIRRDILDVRCPHHDYGYVVRERSTGMVHCLLCDKDRAAGVEPGKQYPDMPFD